MPATLSSAPRLTASGWPRLPAIITLLKPITWFPPMWAYGCGLASVATPQQQSWLFGLAGILLAGPLVCGTSQVINDWFDRHVDAINEPDRPIPSGAVPGRWGLGLAIFFTALSLAFSSMLGSAVIVATIVGLVLAWAYSAPPFRLKQNGWFGNAAVGLCYEGLPWITGAAALAGTWPSASLITIALLYSFGAHGIMTLNDFKSIEGDRQLGLRSIPVQLGAERAALLACAMMALPQIVVIGLLFSWGASFYALGVAVSLAAQMLLMRKLLMAPRENAPWYNQTGISLYVLGMLISAFALKSLG